MTRTLTASDYLQLSHEARAVARECNSLGLPFSVSHHTGDDPILKIKVAGQTYELPFVLGRGNIDEALANFRNLLDEATSPAVLKTVVKTVVKTEPPVAKASAVFDEGAPRVSTSRLNGKFQPDGTFQLSPGGHLVNANYVKRRNSWIGRAKKAGMSNGWILAQLTASGLYMTPKALYTAVYRLGLAAPQRLHTVKVVEVAEPLRSVKVAEVIEPLVEGPHKGEIVEEPVKVVEAKAKTIAIVLPQRVVDQVDAALKQLIDQRLALLLGQAA
jgi:hypothetical protein